MSTDASFPGLHLFSPRELSWAQALSQRGLEGQTLPLSAWSLKIFGTVGGSRGANLARFFEKLGFEKSSR